MILATMNGSSTYIHRVSRAGKAPPPIDMRPLAEQFKEALKNAHKEGIRVSFGKPMATGVCSKCKKLFASGSSRKICAVCQDEQLWSAPKKYKVIGSFDCPYCLKTVDKIRHNQASCSEPDCIIAHARQNLPPDKTWHGKPFFCQNCRKTTPRMSWLQKWCDDCAPKMKIKQDAERRVANKAGRSFIRTGEIFTCGKCEVQQPRKAYNQKYCEPCKLKVGELANNAKKKRMREERKRANEARLEKAEK